MFNKTVTWKTVPKKESGSSGNGLNRCQCRVHDGHQSSNYGEYNRPTDARHGCGPKAKIKKVWLATEVFYDLFYEWEMNSIKIKSR